MKYVVACMAVFGLGLWACGGGGADFTQICKDGVTALKKTYEDCGVDYPTTGGMDCGVYGTGYDLCSNGDDIEKSFKDYWAGYTCNDDNPDAKYVEHDSSTITACTA